MRPGSGMSLAKVLSTVGGRRADRLGLGSWRSSGEPAAMADSQELLSLLSEVTDQIRPTEEIAAVFPIRE